MQTFQEQLSSHMDSKKKISQVLGIPKSQLKRWAKGKDSPHPVIKTALTNYLSELDLNKQLSKKYKKKFAELEETVSAILADADPCQVGKDPEEYNREAREICKQISSMTNSSDLEKLLWAIFTTNSYSVFANQNYAYLAKRIFNAKLDFWKEKTVVGENDIKVK